ncbi:hypothetical protein CIW83_18125 [Tissierella sp. P1]|uniref:hypothetical protein n=1 Tax=Tissierella sp. P1 TaxID=1280483 RepID=UPI000BA0BCCA|nr:hypothetical protein [Tissierella sp. P1]OZV10843.1 hypothetical protein CIW83_18125 [Tissierella sp. P1]
MDFKKEFISLKVLSEEIGIDDTEILSFRPNGKRVSLKIQEIIMNCTISAPAHYIISFKDILLCDISFIDEVLINTIQFIKSNNLDIQIILSDLCSDIRDNIYAAFLLRNKKEKIQGNTKFDVQVLEINNGIYSLIGDLESNLFETLELIKLNSPLTARDLSDILNVPINGSSNRLKRLFDSRLILREMITDEEGKYFKYFL